MSSNDSEVVVYTKLFKQGGTARKSSVRHHPFSFWFPGPMKKAFLIEYGKHIYENDWILGPLYKRNKKNKQGDFQVGATGTLEKGEEHRNAAARELGEEIGIIPKPTQKYIDPLDQFNKIVDGHYTKKNKQKVAMKVYTLYIKDTMPVTEYQHLANLSQDVDDKNFKSGIFVYGSKQDILKFMNNKIYHFQSPDQIVGVAAVRAKDVYEHYY